MSTIATRTNLSLRGLLQEVNSAKDFDIEIDDQNQRYIRIGDGEYIAGPYFIANREVRVLLKVTSYPRDDAFDIQFIVIDCEGDILNHDAYGLEDLNFDLIRRY